MAAKKALDIRDVSPILQKVRNFLLGRQHTLAVRFEECLATRSPPLPELPDGPSHKLNSNYYCNRDVRREVNPPLEISAPKLIKDGENIKSMMRTPGPVYRWD